MKIPDFMADPQHGVAMVFELEFTAQVPALHENFTCTVGYQLHIPEVTTATVESRNVRLTLIKGPLETCGGKILVYAQNMGSSDLGEMKTI